MVLAAAIDDGRFWVIRTFEQWIALGLYYHVIEAIVLCIAAYFFLMRSFKPKRKDVRKGKKDKGGAKGKGVNEVNVNKPRTKEEEDAFILSWKPLPLAAAPRESMDMMEINRNRPVLNGDTDSTLQLVSAATPKCDITGKADVLNLAVTNFSNLLNDSRVVKACGDTLKKFGCGSCGPRGFYGTTTEHLRCEKVFANWMGVPDCISYSFGSATASSVIPAFCKRNDLIVCEETVNFSIQNGVWLSRAKVIKYKPNDFEALERILKSVVDEDRRKKRTKILQRRFIVAEAINSVHGTILPLDKLVALKNKYCFRIMIDESLSVGVLGKTGKGAVEHFGVSRSDVEIMIVDAGNSLASVGGFCVGERGVVSHQRLSGAGYCFSASQPPFLASACIAAIRLLQSEGQSRVSQLEANIKTFYAELRKHVKNGNEINGFVIEGDERSPILFVRKAAEVKAGMIQLSNIETKSKDLESAADNDGDSNEDNDETDPVPESKDKATGNSKPVSAITSMDALKSAFDEMSALRDELLSDCNMLVNVPRYTGMESHIPPPAIRITISAGHEAADLTTAA
eukprot:CAMPEP_0184701498 /NCGR_PEP_ID=MMETSP0313-20130426/20159_1 /TAXON_ID=2792 /ORGANISM="Porphyridium aerugineum, Strain SAG 1380-2" /LENGTH=568 /DNA_ID=CAMNT_0027161585 /DNA_START=121 /DNA_END=1823 /DNA_ORIENTATION=+